MEKLEVRGANVLKGQVKISGSKNASLPILAATLLSNKKIQLSNLPKVKDIETMILLLKSLDTKIKYSKNNKILSIENKKKTLELTIDEMRNFAFNYIEKFAPSKQQLKTYLLKKYLKYKIPSVKKSNSKWQ